jgi:hypothetical protein
MVNRINRKSDSKADKLTHQGNWVSAARTSVSSQPKYIDDLIVSLANAHENRRARQVIEWEQMPRHYIQRSA